MAVERSRVATPGRQLILLGGAIMLLSGCGATVQIERRQGSLPPHRGAVALLVPGQAINGRALASIRVSGAFGAGFLDSLYEKLVAAARDLGANAVVVEQVRAVIASVEEVRGQPCNDFITEALLNALDAERRDNPPVCHVSEGTYDAGYRVVLEGRALRLPEGKP